MSHKLATRSLLDWGQLWFTGTPWTVTLNNLLSKELCTATGTPHSGKRGAETEPSLTPALVLFLLHHIASGSTVNSLGPSPWARPVTLHVTQHHSTEERNRQGFVAGFLQIEAFLHKGRLRKLKRSLSRRLRNFMEVPGFTRAFQQVYRREEANLKGSCLQDREL